MMTVRDAMHVGVECCDSSTTVRDAARMMHEKGLRSLVVIDFDCALAGIISETDIVAHRLVHSSDKPWEQMTVGEIMTSRVLTVTPDTPLQEAARILIDHRIHRLVVAEPDDMCKPIGILSMGDLMRYVMRLEEGGEIASPAKALKSLKTRRTQQQKKRTTKTARPRKTKQAARTKAR
ncbi:MAG: cyclic nucleotide-binding/CBS domain-containing protein [Thermoflexales bacterium]